MRVSATMRVSVTALALLLGGAVVWVGLGGSERSLGFERAPKIGRNLSAEDRGSSVEFDRRVRARFPPGTPMREVERRRPTFRPLPRATGRAGCPPGRASARSRGGRRGELGRPHAPRRGPRGGGQDEPVAGERQQKPPLAAARTGAVRGGEAFGLGHSAVAPHALHLDHLARDAGERDVAPSLAAPSRRMIVPRALRADRRTAITPGRRAA